MSSTTVRTFGYACFGEGCLKEFDSLGDMEYVDGKGSRSGRHFCIGCATDMLEGRGEADA